MDLDDERRGLVDADDVRLQPGSDLHLGTRGRDRKSEEEKR